MEKLVAAVDIGGTNTVFGLVNGNGEIVKRGNISTTLFSEPEILVNEVSKEILALMASIPNSELKGIGIGAPNGNYFKGTIEYAPNLNWFGIIPIGEFFEKKLGVKAKLTNDANAAALGEMKFGGAKNLKDFIFVTLGTGLGSGIIVNKHLVYGHDSFAGELGHVIIDPNGRPCGCGRNGCLETYASATGIKRTYLDKMMSKHQSKSMQDKVSDAHLIFQNALKGEIEAIESFNYTGEMLGLALANAVAITSPEAIFLSGGLAKAGHFIFRPTIESFERNLLNIYKGKIQILPSSLNENDAALLGAASLIWV